MENTLDDLMRGALKALLSDGVAVQASRGKTKELFGVLLELGDPRARVSRTESRQVTLFSCMGELLWYLAGSDELEFITYYIDMYRAESEDGEHVRSAYGPRLFGHASPQIRRMVDVLRKKRTSRRAVVQLYRAEDTDADHREAPCTCTLQFVIRHEQLHMLTFMRSNDAYKGLPHDVFSFTMLQELLAAELGVALGPYRHAVGSLHLYDRDAKNARKYVEEGWQSTVSMPHMPTGDPWPAVKRLLAVEKDLREGENLIASDPKLDPYWQDLERLLRIYSHYRKGETGQILQVKAQMRSRFFDHFIAQKANSKARPRTATLPKQCKLPFS